MIQQFMAMDKKKESRLATIDGQEKNQIMLEFVRMNTSFDNGQIHQSLSEQQTPQAGNETGDLLLIGSFVGDVDMNHKALQKLFQ